MMKHILDFDEKHGVLKMKVPSHWKFDEKEAAEFLDHILKLYEGKKHRYLLTDVSDSPGQKLSKKVRRWMSKQAVRIGIEKVAVVGASPATRMIAKIIMSAMGKAKDTRFFKTEKQALGWFSSSCIKEEIDETQSLVR